MDTVTCHHTSPSAAGPSSLPLDLPLPLLLLLLVASAPLRLASTARPALALRAGRLTCTDLGLWFHRRRRLCLVVPVLVLDAGRLACGARPTGCKPGGASPACSASGVAAAPASLSPHAWAIEAGHPGPCKFVICGQRLRTLILRFCSMVAGLCSVVIDRWWVVGGGSHY